MSEHKEPWYKVTPWYRSAPLTVIMVGLMVTWGFLVDALFDWFERL